MSTQDYCDKCGRPAKDLHFVQLAHDDQWWGECCLPIAILEGRGAHFPLGVFESPKGGRVPDVVVAISGDAGVICG